MKDLWDLEVCRCNSVGRKRKQGRKGASSHVPLGVGECSIPPDLQIVLYELRYELAVTLSDLEELHKALQDERLEGPMGGWCPMPCRRVLNC